MIVITFMVLCAIVSALGWDVKNLFTPLRKNSHHRVTKWGSYFFFMFCFSMAVQMLVGLWIYTHSCQGSSSELVSSTFFGLQPLGHH
jgi:amino acid transporter